MLSLIKILILASICPHLLNCSDPDEFLNVTMLIQSRGFPAEEHDVTTQDGYILSVHRIPNPGKPAVFLQHGLLDGSHTWVINFENQSLGFILWNAGYDVWMGNMRGNTYGLRHTKLSPKQDEFWDFSWSNMAEFDLTAMVEYALKTSGQKDLIYVGHSQGTLIAFSQLGTNARLASQIKLFVATGPVSHVSNIKSPIKVLADFGADSTQLIYYKIFGKRDFLPSTQIVKWISDKVCNDQTLDKLLCENILFVVAGPSKFMNETRIPVYTTHSPAGTSTKNLVHFSQMVISGKFQMYDFGSAQENLAHYNQTQPPLYDLTKIKTPVALYWASEDWLADPKDVLYLRQNLPNIVDDFCVNKWNHLDFVWATNTRDALFDRMLDLMKKYQ